MPVEVVVSSAVKRRLFELFCAENAVEWSASHARARIAQIPSECSELSRLQYDQIRRQWKNFCGYVTVLRQVSRHLLFATGEMMACEELILSAVKFALFHLKTAWPDMWFPVHAATFVEHIEQHQLRDDEAMLGESDILTLDGLRAFVIEYLLPEYSVVWEHLQLEETRIADSLSGDLGSVMEDLELQFQAKRLHLALNPRLICSWNHTLFMVEFCSPPAPQILQRIQLLLTESGSDDTGDLPPLVKAYLTGEDCKSWALAALRVFEEGIQQWYLQNLAWRGQLVFRDDQRGCDHRSGSYPNLDSRVDALYDQSAYTDARSHEHFGTVLYITGAALRKASKLCRERQLEKLSELFSEGMRLTQDEASQTYGEIAILKLLQREQHPNSLIIARSEILLVFLRAEAVIHDVADSPNTVAALGNQLWRVVDGVVRALGLADDLAQLLNICHTERYGHAITDKEAIEVDKVCDATLNYYVRSVRTKDKVSMMNMSSRRDGVEKLSFRGQVAAGLADSSVDEHKTF